MLHCCMFAIGVPHQPLYQCLSLCARGHARPGRASSLRPLVPLCWWGHQALAVTSSASPCQTRCCKSTFRPKSVIYNLQFSHTAARAWWSETGITSSYLFPARPDPSLPRPDGPVAQRCHCSTSAPSLKDLSVSAITRPPSCLLARAWRLQQQEQKLRFVRTKKLRDFDGCRHKMTYVFYNLSQAFEVPTAVIRDSSHHKQSWKRAHVRPSSTNPLPPTLTHTLHNCQPS
jgi:hypothetical protein